MMSYLRQSRGGFAQPVWVELVLLAQRFKGCAVNPVSDRRAISRGRCRMSSPQGF